MSPPTPRKTIRPSAMPERNVKILGPCVFPWAGAGGAGSSRGCCANAVAETQKAKAHRMRATDFVIRTSFDAGLRSPVFAGKRSFSGFVPDVDCLRSRPPGAIQVEATEDRKAYFGQLCRLNGE